MNKTIGLILVTVGLGLAAGFGAYLSPGYRGALVQEGEATLSDSAVDGAFEAYCTAREKSGLAPAEGCGDSSPLVAPDDAKPLSKAELRTAQLAAIEGGPAGLPDGVSTARGAYAGALQTSRKLWTTVEAAGTRGPGERLSGWLSVGGAGFGVGILLLLVGSWICRKADASEGETGDAGESDAVDFGVLLSSVLDDVASLAADMEAMEAPTVDALDDFKRRLEDVQKEEMARLCASGPAVQRRHGLQGMALLFSPLSSAERKMNRSWAALVDRHWPESLASVRGALNDLESAQSELHGLQHAGN